MVGVLNQSRRGRRWGVGGRKRLTPVNVTERAERENDLSCLKSHRRRLYDFLKLGNDYKRIDAQCNC